MIIFNMPETLLHRVASDFCFLFQNYSHMCTGSWSKNKNSNSYSVCSMYISWNYYFIVVQLWVLQGKICLVFDICCRYLLSWFRSYNCSWLSKLVDFTGTCSIETLLCNFSIPKSQIFSVINSWSLAVALLNPLVNC